MDDIRDLLEAAQRTEICLASLPGFRPAKQVRSQQKADRIVSSAAYLLQQRSFSAISVQDIAQLADCAVTAIYARFDDKEAILPAIHQIILEHRRVTERIKFGDSQYSPISLDVLSHDLVEESDVFHERNRFFFEAAIRGGNSYILQQSSQYVSEQGQLLSPVVGRLLGREPGQTRASLEFALRLLNALYRDRVAGGRHSGVISLPEMAALFAMTVRAELAG